MVETHYSTAFTHILLAGSTLWALKSTFNTTEYPYKWIYGTFVPLLVLSILGIFRFGNPQYGYKLRTLYNNILFLSSTLCFPCMAIELHFYYGYDGNFALMNIVAAVFPIVCHYASKKPNEYMSDMSLIISLLFVCYIGYVARNYYALAAALCYAGNFFVIGTCGTFADMPAVELFTVGLCFFNWFTARAVKD